MRKARNAAVFTTFKNQVPKGFMGGKRDSIKGELKAMMIIAGIMKNATSIDLILVDLMVADIMKNPVKEYTAPLTGV